MTAATQAAQVRFLAMVLAVCAIVLGIVLGLAPLGVQDDPVAAYRDPARTLVARAVVVRSDPAGLLVRFLDEEGHEARAALASGGAPGPDGTDQALPVASVLDVVVLRGQPGTAVVPRTALGRPAPDLPSRLPGMLAMVAGVGGGLAGLWAARRAGWEQWLDWFGGEAVADTAVPPAAERPGRPRGPVIAPQGCAIRRKVGAAGLMVVGLLVLAIGVPPLVRTTWGAVASLDWPVVDGTVTESRLRLWHSNGPSDSTEQVARVVFTYVVDGRRFTADTPEWTIIGAGWGADAEGVVARYPRGAVVPVRYDPADPYRAVLRPGPLPVSTAVFCGLAAACMVGWLWGVRVLLRPLPPKAGGM